MLAQEDNYKRNSGDLSDCLNQTDDTSIAVGNQDYLLKGANTHEGEAAMSEKFLNRDLFNRVNYFPLD